jgi:SHS2 domain-containing protein
VAPGHRILAHPADLALEAWAPGKYECLAEAVRALVASFADVRAARPGEAVTVTADADTDEELLAAVLDEVIYQVEAHGRVPVEVSVTAAGAAAEARPGASIRFTAAPASQAVPVGPVPKGVSRHQLRFAPRGGQWRCHAVVDV